MQYLNLYRADHWDGGDRHIPTKFHFHDANMAKEVAGEQGHVASVEIIICDNIQEVEEANRVESVIRMLKPLGKSDLKSMGLPEDHGKAVDAMLARLR